ncbi:uncharacterized protein C8A04DRAFT_28107 [Dichotomopilus funicola]|uniref:Uncharacterized protein n=1 Tax=Dichotomopilus funicola TaxID=1934379 RepID=A0AAN6V3T3_9PEZI|nr:hypothetical protein C8A04DRAFT_28107 [Dichotomopilus funicola]
MPLSSSKSSTSLRSADDPQQAADSRGLLSPGRFVEKLTRKLSKQSLRLSRLGPGQQQMQPTLTTEPSLPSPSLPPLPPLPSLSSLPPLSPTEAATNPSTTTTLGGDASELHSFQPWTGYAAGGRSSYLATSRPTSYVSSRRTTPGGYAPPMLDLGDPIEIDPDYLDPQPEPQLEPPLEVRPEKPDDKRLADLKRPRRQTSGQLRSLARSVDQRLEDMIADGTQCIVRNEPLPTTTTEPPSAPPTRPSSTIYADPVFIEPDPECCLPNTGTALEVDENETGEGSELLSDLFGQSGTTSLRNASGPGGIRKHTVNGVDLRYRLSADAALRCTNVVRSRPRMRKRNKPRHGSGVSSIVTSPTMSCAPSPPLPPMNYPP